ncbi:hypothetical protein BD560DRAFT_428271 [Blakeslea trispora]|nr:hypothetical protein BD560DRAFT_428271 [Blakeslea trispora]
MNQSRSYNQYNGQDVCYKINANGRGVHYARPINAFGLLVHCTPCPLQKFNAMDDQLVVVLDFANTEEIPVFLRNWNVNKKRRFKPKISNCSPAKRQRRSGPDSHNHSHSINRL